MIVTQEESGSFVSPEKDDEEEQLEDVLVKSKYDFEQRLRTPSLSVVIFCC
jgi:hypothetical protein